MSYVPVQLMSFEKANLCLRTWIGILILGALTMCPTLSRAQAALPIRWGFGSLIDLFTVAFSPNGMTLAVGGDGGVNVYSVSGIPEWSPNTLIRPCTSVAFSPDGKILAIAGKVGNGGAAVELWSQDTHTRLYSLGTAVGLAPSIAFSPNGTTFAVGGNSTTGSSQTSVGILEVWNAATGSKDASLLTSETYVGCIAFSPDGKSLAAGGGDGTSGILEIWSISKGVIQKRLKPRGAKNFTSLAFSPDGSLLACGGTFGLLYGGFIQLWNVTAGSLMKSLPTTIATTITSMSFSPNGKYLVDSGQTAFFGGWALQSSGGTELWDLSAGGEVKNLPATYGTENAVAFSHDGRFLAQIATGYSYYSGHQWAEFSPSQGSFSIWNVDAGTVQVSTTTGTGAQFQVDHFAGGIKGGTPSMSPSDKLLAGGLLGESRSPAGGTTNYVPLWNNITGTFLGGLLTNVNGGWYSSGFAPDNRHLAIVGTHFGSAVSSATGVLEIWDVFANRLIHSLNTGVNSGGQIAFSRDSTLLACAGNVGSNNFCVEIWSVSTGKLLGILSSAATSSLTCVTFSPDGRYLVDGGATLVSGDPTGVVEIWDLAGGRLVGKLNTAVTSVESVAISSDGNNIAVGGARLTSLPPNTVAYGELWNLATQELVANLPLSTTTFSTSLTGVKFSKDGRTLFATSYGSIQAFDLDKNALDGYLVTPGNAYASLSSNTGFAILNDSLGGVRVGSLPAIVSVPIASMTISAPTVFNFGSVQCSVILTKPAPPGGVTLALQSTKPSSLWIPVTIPLTATIRAGAISTTFTIVTPYVTSPSTVTVSAFSGPYSSSVNLTILCANVSALSIDSTSVVGGATLTGTVDIDHAAGLESPTVTITSDNPAVTIPTGPYFPYGTKNATFSINTSAVKTKQTVMLTATGGSTTKTVTLTVTPT